MAPVSHFALAALTVTSVAAAPLPTPSCAADILQPRSPGFLDQFLDDWNLFGKWLDSKTKVNTKNLLENALDVEKQLKGGYDKRDDGALGIVVDPWHNNRCRDVIHSSNDG